MRVELAGTWSRGRTIVDRRDWDGNLAHDPHGQAPALVDVALAVDGERYAQLWLETVTGVTDGFPGTDCVRVSPSADPEPGKPVNYWD